LRNISKLNRTTFDRVAYTDTGLQIDSLVRFLGAVVKKDQSSIVDVFLRERPNAVLRPVDECHPAVDVARPGADVVDEFARGRVGINGV